MTVKERSRQQKRRQKRRRHQKQQQSRKLSFSSLTFFVIKLIILMLLPFISIKADDFSTRLSSQMDAVNFVSGRNDVFKVNTLSNEKVNIVQGPFAAVADDVKIRIDGMANNKTTNSSIIFQSQKIDDDEKDSFHKGKFNENGERILSRNRRYLTFPEGSSLQLVFDTYHPIVDKSNLLILGITAACAWELPSKPFYIDEDLKNSYEMGNLPLLHRNDKNSSTLKYTASKKHRPSHAPIKYTDRKNDNHKSIYYTNEQASLDFHQKNYDRPTIYSPSNLLRPKEGHPQPYWSPSPSDGSRWPTTSNKMQYYLSYADKLFKNFNGLTAKIPRNPSWTQFANVVKNTLNKRTKSKSKPFYRKNFVHPVFKKRSASTGKDLPLIEQFDLKHHRKTRQALYRHIEKFLGTQGNNGLECILKTLCETGQRSNEDEPGSMVVELLRAVFTLPEPLDPVVDPLHRRFDQAHVTTRDCQKMFPDCPHSIWTSKFNS